MPVGDAAAMRAAILSLWNDPQRAEQMGQNARAFIEKYHTLEMFTATVRSSAAEATLEGRIAPGDMVGIATRRSRAPAGALHMTIGYGSQRAATAATVEPVSEQCPGRPPGDADESRFDECPRPDQRRSRRGRSATTSRWRAWIIPPSTSSSCLASFLPTCCGVARRVFPLFQVVLGLIVAVCIASANYVINEYLDREFDKYHPTKSRRRAVERDLRGWRGRHGMDGIRGGWPRRGLDSPAPRCSPLRVIFALQGIVYNVQPLRSKDKPYWDVISESINNPLRLMIGWVMVDPHTLPPSSIILAYWLGGAFLMAAKRYSEYREIVASHGAELLIRYRASFAGYSEVSLGISCFVYGLLSTFFLAIFLIKYRVEYLLLVPVVIALFGYYMALSSKPASSAQNPEKLFRERKLIALVVLLVVTFVVATFVDMPALSVFTGQQYITLK